MTVEIRPQKGPQEAFMSTPADIAIYGGAAGGGKTYALLMEPLRHKENPKFGAVTFRRESGQISTEGGAWDTALEMYAPIVKNPDRDFVRSPRYTVRFPAGSKHTFAHLQQEKHVKQWDGSQIPLIQFDELQHFTSTQFWYMLSRNRSTCGVKPYIRATCNPDPDSFLLQLLEWWIDQETGYPIEERSGIIRYFVRVSGTVFWGDTKEELLEQFPVSRPKSFTFIKSELKDNPALMQADPDYESNIDAMLDYERKRLKGNWFARPLQGELFKKHYFEIIDDVDRTQIIDSMRYWDRAATEPSEANEDPDWTAGALVHKMLDGTYVVEDIARDRVEPADVENMIFNSASMDEVTIGLEQEPGASGKSEIHTYEILLQNYDMIPFPKRTSKLASWKPAAILAKNGKIKLVRAHWNRAFLDEAESVTDGTQSGHDDQIDALSGAINYLNQGSFGFASLKGV